MNTRSLRQVICQRAAQSAHDLDIFRTHVRKFRGNRSSSRLLFQAALLCTLGKL